MRDMRAFLLVFSVVCGSAIACAAAEKCAEIATFADNKKPLREIFVSPGGDNFKNDGSRKAPFQTINRAVQEIRAGDAIRLLPGNYTNGAYLQNVSGTSNAPVWFGGEANQPKPVFTGPNSSVHLSRVRYFILENIEVTDTKSNGVNCDDGGDFANSNATRHVIFRNLNIHDTGSGGNQDGLKLSGVNDFFVLDSQFTRTSVNGSGIDHVGCHGGLIAGCTFIEGGNSVQCKGGSEDIEIRSCRFVRPRERAINIGGSTGLTLFRPPITTNAANAEARNIRVFANIFEGTAVTPIAYVGAVNCIVANNTIINPNRWIIRILQEMVSQKGYEFLPCRKNAFVNNLIYYNGAKVSVPVNIGSNVAADTFEFSNNLWFDHNNPQRSRPELPSAEKNGVYGQDPLFKNSTNDFTLREGSPAVGKGKSVAAVRGDFDGRCYSNPPSIGALK
jgi:hypothetical protein